MARDLSHSARYERIKILGEGGAGRVWLVRDQEDSDRLLALKELIRIDPAGESRLREEFATLRTLLHPNLVEANNFQVDPDSGLAQFTMEYIEGVDIVTALRTGANDKLLPFVAEALRALSFLHDFGLVHRDLKPENILVRRQPRRSSALVLLDFGLAIQRHGAPELKGVGGTLQYLAPELLVGGNPSVKSDLYSLGVLVYEAVLGHPPEEPVNSDLADFIRRVSQESRIIPPLPGQYPEGLRDWLKGLLATDPRDRPSTASEALAQLNSVCALNFEIETRTTRAARLASGAPPGRDRELHQLMESLEPETGARLVLLTGDAGSGKSRVLRWLSAEAARHGRSVTMGTHGLLSEDVRENKQDSASAAVRSRAEFPECTALVLIDDPESAGMEAIHAIERVVRNPDSAPYCMVVTVRPNEVRNRKLRSLLDESGWNPEIRRVDLAPMNTDSIARVAARVEVVGAEDGPMVQWLQEASEGNALILESLLVDDAWRQRRDSIKHPTLEESVAKRVSLATPTTQQWLEALVVLGREAGSWHLREFSGLSTAAAEQAEEEAGLLGLAVRRSNGWSAGSDIIARFVLAQIPHERSRQLHHRAAEMLESDPNGPSVHRQLARLWKGAGEPDRSINHAVEVAKQAKARGRAEEAAHWFRFAVCQLRRGDSRRRDLRLEHAEALVSCGRYGAASRAMATVLRLSPGEEDRAGLLVKQAYNLMREGHLKRGAAIADEAGRLAMSRGQEDIAARAKKASGMSMVWLQEHEDALPLFQELAEQSLERGDRSLYAECLHMLTVCASNLRELDQARGFSDRALNAIDAVGNYDLLVGNLIGRGIVERRAWNHDAALQNFERACRVVDDHGLQAHLPLLMSNIALIHQDVGRYDEALRVLEETIPLAYRSNDRSRLLGCLLMKGTSLTLVGRPTEGARLIRDCLQRFERGVDPRLLRYALLNLAEAEVELPDVDTRRISDVLREAMTDEEKDPKLRSATLTLEMERQVLAGVDESFEGVYETFVACRKSLLAGDESVVDLRAEIARAQALHQLGKTPESETVARIAATLAQEKDLPEFEARAWAVASEAQRSLGRSAEADRTHRRAREALDRAAQRIGDEEMRQGFLDRPVFRSIRKSPEDPRSSGEQRLLAIYDMLRVLNSETDPDLLLETMLDMALDVVQAERGLILLRDGDGEDADYSVRLARNLEKQTIDDVAEFSRNVVLRAGSGKAVLAIDTGDDDRLKDLKSVSMFGIRSVLCVPLRSRARIVGAVYLDNRKEGALFSPDDLRFLEAFADHAALALENARVRKELEVENSRLRVAADERVSFDSIIGHSGPMQAIYDMIPKTAKSHLPVLIQGESGTGKELVARAIHAHSLRKRKPFLVENCAAIPEALLESELFGHVRGAFTGADRDHTGLFEQAHGGTLFLDEIGDMPASMQARLLRVLQEGEVRRVGAERIVRVDVRLVTATHRDLPSQVAAGRFREDLLYRLQVLVIQLPPLRDRPGDIPLLVDHFLRRISRERGLETPKIRSNVMSSLEGYSWPGNVRQLENHIQRIALLAGDGPITLSVLEQDKGLREALLGKKTEGTPVFSLEHSEKEQIRQALEAAKGNRTRAARMLGISRATIFRKIKEYELT